MSRWQAGGVTVASGSTARDVDIREVQEKLLKQNVSLGSSARLAELGAA